MNKADKIIHSPAPSRVLMLLPSNCVEHKFLRIADLSGCPVFEDQSLTHNFSLVLALNKESLVLDPIDWVLTCSRLHDWSNLIAIDKLTDSLFRERVPVKGICRASALNRSTSSMKGFTGSVFSFHRPLSQTVNGQLLKSCLVSSRVRTTISNINKHRFSLLALGILPNQLRRLLRPVWGIVRLYSRNLGIFASGVVTRSGEQGGTGWRR